MRGYIGCLVRVCLLDVANDGALFVIGVNRPFFSTLKFRDALEDFDSVKDD